MLRLQSCISIGLFAVRPAIMSFELLLRPAAVSADTGSAADADTVSVGGAAARLGRGMSGWLGCCECLQRRAMAPARRHGAEPPAGPPPPPHQQQRGHHNAAFLGDEEVVTPTPAPPPPPDRQPEQPGGVPRPPSPPVELYRAVPRPVREPNSLHALVQRECTPFPGEGS